MQTPEQSGILPTRIDSFSSQSPPILFRLSRIRNHNPNTPKHVTYLQKESFTATRHIKLPYLPQLAGTITKLHICSLQVFVWIHFYLLKVQILIYNKLLICQCYIFTLFNFNIQAGTPISSPSI